MIARDHLRIAERLLLSAILVTTGCTVVERAPQSPSTSSDAAFSILELDQQEFDAPPAGYADPALGVDDSSWRLMRTTEDIAVYIGDSGDAYCVLILETDIGSQTCQYWSETRPLSLLSETPDGRGTVLYVIVADDVRAIRSESTECMAANNLVIIQNPAASTTEIEVVSQQGEVQVEPVPSSGDGDEDDDDGQSPGDDPVCL